MAELGELIVLCQGAHAAAEALRSWVIKHFELGPNDIDGASARSVAQFDQADRFARFCGYEITDAPPQHVVAIRAYMDALREGRQLSGGRPIPEGMIARHQHIVECADVPGRRRGRPRK